MEFAKIKFYNHKRKEMSGWHRLQIGEEGSFVYDKTTDGLKANFVTDNKPAVSYGDWAFVAHFANDIDETLTYNSNGTPKNHEQYVVASFTKNKKGNKWITSLALQEPIEMAKGIATETLSFTNQTQKTVIESGVEVVYTKEPYNVLTALERILTVTPANNDIAKSWYTRINILDWEFLQTIPFADDTYSAGDLFTILFSIDDIIDRTPVFYFNMSNIATDKKPKYLLKFERKDGFDKDELEFSDLISGSFNYAESGTIENYATGIKSEVDNLTVGTSVTFPNINMWGVPQYDTDDRTVPSGDTYKGKFYIKLPTAIKRIISVKKLTMSGADWFGGTPIPAHYYPIKRELEDEVENKYILEKQEYLASLLLDTDKDKLIWFEQGNDRVYFNEYYLNSTYYNPVSAKNYKGMIYNIVYEPLISSALMQGENEYTLTINQSNSQTESLKYSQFMETYLKSMDKADIIFAKKYTNFGDFAEHIGSLVVNDNEKYIVTKLTYQNLGGVYIVIYQLNKDNLRRSLNVSASQQIRASRQIDYSNIKDRRSVYKKTIILSTTSFGDVPMGNDWKRLLLTALSPNSYLNNTPQIVLAEYSSSVKRNGTASLYESSFALNFSKILTNNQIQFSIKTDDNAQIGIKKEPFSQTGGLGNFSSSFGNTQKQTPILFTNPFGEIDKFSIVFTYWDYATFLDIDSENNQAEYNRTRNMYLLMANLPSIPSYIKTTLMANTIFRLDNMNKYKDMLEIENDSFVFEVDGGESILVSPSLLKYSRLNQKNDNHTVIIKGFEEKKGLNDLTGDYVFSNTATTLISYRHISLKIPKQNTDNIKSLVIETDAGEKLLILNEFDKDLLKNSGDIELYYKEKGDE